LSIVCTDGSATTGITYSGQPLQYVYAYHLPNANTTTVSVAIVFRYLNTATQDPGDFRTSTAEQYAHATVAIRPV